MKPSIAVVIPCYKVRAHILDVISRIGPEVSAVFVVDDSCPEQTGQLVQRETTDGRVSVIFHEQNRGVGGAVITGYRAAVANGNNIIVKIDGDGQISPELVPEIVAPIISGEADYVKGNRFFSLSHLQQMPAVRRFGNSALSFVNKASSGYWNIMDPCNGFTAIHGQVVQLLPLETIAERYFFESDMLFRLGEIRAVVTDIPQIAHYGDEKSNLSISSVAVEFPGQYLSRFFKRIFHSYFLRDFNVCSLELVAAFVFLVSGAIFGGIHWYLSIVTATARPTGTVVLAALLITIGMQCLLSAISYDVQNIPSRPVHKLYRHAKQK